MPGFHRVRSFKGTRVPRFDRYGSRKGTRVLDFDRSCRGTRVPRSDHDRSCEGDQVALPTASACAVEERVASDGPLALAATQPSDPETTLLARHDQGRCPFRKRVLNDELRLRG